MLKKICLALCCAVLLWGTQAEAAEATKAAGDTYFADYLASVKGLNPENGPEEGRKAAELFVVYLHKVIENNTDFLLKYLADSVYMERKEYPKSDVLQSPRKFFTPAVIKGVLQNMIEQEATGNEGMWYGIGGGFLWFYFLDDKADKPVIFSINDANK